MADKAKTTVSESPEAKKNPVKVHLFKDGSKYKGDVFVAVNGRAIQIKRGETVEIGPEYAEVLDHSMEQDSATADLIERESAQYAAAAKVMGI